MDSGYHGYQRFVPLNHEAEASDVNEASETYPWGDKEGDGNCDGRSFENPEDNYPSEDCDVEGDTPQSHDDDTEGYGAQVDDNVSDMEDAGSWDHPQGDGSCDDEAQSPNTDNASYLKQSDNQPGYPAQPAVDNTEHPSWEDHRVFSSRHTIGQTQYWNFSSSGLRASQPGKEPDTDMVEPENISESEDQTAKDGLEQAHDTCMSSANNNQDDVNEEPSDFTDADSLPVDLSLSNQRSARVIKTEPSDRTYENFGPSLDENKEEPAECDMPYTDESGLVRDNPDDLPSNLHSCTVCGRSLANAKSLRSHMRIHSGEKPYECKECGERFRLKETLKSHGLKTHAALKPYKCQQCPSEYLHKKTLNRHQKATGHTGMYVSSLFEDMASNKAAEGKYPFGKEAKKADNMMNNKAKEFPLGHAITSAIEHSSFQEGMMLEDSSSKPYSDVSASTDAGGSHQDSRQGMSIPEGGLFSPTVEHSEPPINNINIKVEPSSDQDEEADEEEVTAHEDEEWGEDGEVVNDSNMATFSYGSDPIMTNDQGECHGSEPMITDNEGYHGSDPVTSEHNADQGYDGSDPVMAKSSGGQAYVGSDPVMAKPSSSQGHECEVCKETFPTKQSLKSHSITHQRGSYKCSQCQVEYAHKKNFIKHQLRMHNIKAPGSELLTEASSTDDNTTKTGKSGDDMKPGAPFMCIICGGTFKRRTSLMVHQRIHTGERPYECERCGERFRIKECLTSHLLKHENLKPYKCNQCPAEYINKKTLNRHLRAHASVFVCGVCNKSFGSSTGLSKHKVTHSTERPYKCLQCEKMFKDSKCLMDHIQCMHPTERPFVCTQCGEAFASVKFLNRHALIHNEERYKCSVCGIPCRYRSDLIRHRKSHKTEKRCKICDAIFFDRRLLAEHMQGHHTEGVEKLQQLYDEVANAHKGTKQDRFPCQMCGMFLKNSKHVKEHMLKHQNPRPNQCQYCFHTFPTPEATRLHEARHNASTVHKCKLCPSSFLSRRALSNHENKHTEVAQNITNIAPKAGQKIYNKGSRSSKSLSGEDDLDDSNDNLEGDDGEWPVSDQLEDDPDADLDSTDQDQPFSFTLNQALDPDSGIEPINVSIPDSTADPDAEDLSKPYKCVYCGMGLMKQSAYKAHIRYRHFPNLNSTCTVCNLKFHSPLHLSQHMVKHRDQERPKCDTCGLTFKTRDCLRQHQMLHSDVRPHVCTVCGKGFTQAFSLRSHMRSHTNEKPFSCPHCDASFRLHSSLKKHIPIHSNTPQFTCEVCGMHFMRKDSYRSHVKIHESKRPFQCPLCKTTFATEEELKRHQDKHDNPYRCKYCGKMYTTKGSMYSHRKTHKVDMELGLAPMGAPVCDDIQNTL